jgi:hypothetical protein
MRLDHIHQRVKLSAQRAVVVSMLVDTGATFSVIPESLARAAGIQRLRRSVIVALAWPAGQARRRYGDLPDRQPGSAGHDPRG